MRLQPTHSPENHHLSAEEQAKRNIAILRSRARSLVQALSPEDLSYLEQLLLRLEKAETTLSANRATAIRSHIRATWQGTITNNAKSTLRTADTFSDDAELRKFQEQKFKLMRNLQLAVDRSPEATRALQETIATYYADLIVEAEHTTSYTVDKCKREIGLTPITCSKTGEVRSLDIVLVADLAQKGLNTGYLGIFTVAKKVTALLENLFKNGLIDKVNPDHALLRPASEGGYTKDQLELICLKLRAYSTAERTRKAIKA